MEVIAMPRVTKSRTHPSFQQRLDTRALEIASSIDGRQNRHEEECVRRYDSIDTKLDTMLGVIWKAAVATIGLLLALAGFLLKAALHL
jgi:hypothetical protein